MSGGVWLVGAGPGDPDLITVRGRRLLERADVVLYDRLAGPELLSLTRPDAELIEASKAPGLHTLRQEEIQALMIERALAGKEVVRLKGGDPFVFGRGWEEVEACTEAGVRCEVVAGLTSAVAVATHAGVPLTVRGRACTVGIFTPSVGTGLPCRDVPYEALARLDTIVALMAGSRLGEIVDGLVAQGKDPDTPTIVVQEGTLPAERRVRAPLRAIADVVERAGLTPPLAVVIGPGAGLARVTHGSAATDDAPGPLAGRRIVVTRPSGASRGLAAKLRRFGGEVIDSPLIQVEYVDVDPWPDPDQLEWAVFTSPHSVWGLTRQLECRQLDARWLAGMRIAAVGPKTAGQLRRIGLRADLVPEVHRTHALVDAIGAEARPGQRVLFPFGTLAVRQVTEGLTGAGLGVRKHRVYDTLLRKPGAAAAVAFRKGVDAVLLHSPSAADALASSDLRLGGVRVLCIGETTAEAARAAGLPVHGVPEVHDDDGMIGCLLAVLGRSQ